MRPVGDDVDNVVPRAEATGPHPESRVHAWDMADAVPSFGLERCAAMLQSGQLGSFVKSMVSSGRSSLFRSNCHFTMARPAGMRQRSQLAGHTLGAQAGQRSLSRCAQPACRQAEPYRSPPGTGPLDGRLAADIRKLADALRGLRQLIVEQCPEDSVYRRGLRIDREERW